MKASLIDIDLPRTFPDVVLCVDVDVDVDSRVGG